MDADPEATPRSRLPLLLGGAVVLAGLIVAAAILLVPDEPPPPPADAPAAAAPAPAPRKPGPAAPAPAPAPKAPSLPLPAPAPKPDTAAADRAFEAAVGTSERLAAAGDAVGALAALRASADPRAAAEAAAFQNRLRAAYNDTVSAAKKLADAGKPAEGAALLEARAKGTLPEIAAKAAEAAGRLRKAAADREAHGATEKSEAARKAFREEQGPTLAAALKARRWPEALALLDAAGADPLRAPLRKELSDERSFLALGAALHDAFVKALQSRLNQETSILLVGNARLLGRLLAIENGRAVVATSGETSLDVPLDQVSPDQVVAWTVGKALAPEDGLTWLKAAVFFFGEGRDDLAALYLATAKEKGAEIDEVERLWREGLTRQALTK
jgi:hypothetical protein